ncbi:phage tail protein [Ureibacillus sp. Re31]|uniref:Phage tail protein n=1 Tax=Ureibacillus galli TaxID=2762222 RepID=A0ABR8XG17_9BACL|nr:major tail protein [Ureibacillus galli]MBD8028146.1 phage tail protein [Ureibacillus galli]
MELDIQFFAENKVEFGLSNVHYAPYTMTDGEPVFETPIPIPGAVTLTGDPLGESTSFYADNMIYYVTKSNQGYDATLSIATIPQQFAIDALGEEFDEVDGVINEVADSQGKPFALLFQFEGDVKATRHVLYNCTANRPSINGNTKTDSTEITPNELTLTASPIEIGGKLMVKTKTTSTTTADIYNNWFKTVYKKTVVAGA